MSTTITTTHQLKNGSDQQMTQKTGQPSKPVPRHLLPVLTSGRVMTH